MTFAIALLTVNAVLRLMTGACTLYHQILLAPDRPNYPNGRSRLRIALFLLGVVLVYNGVDLLVRAFARPTPEVVPSGLLLSVGLFGAEVLRLERHMRHWLPERLQARIQRWLHMASCANRDALAQARHSAMARVEVPTGAMLSAAAIGPVLAELALAGVAVIGPGEPPSAVRDALELAPRSPPPAE